MLHLELDPAIRRGTIAQPVDPGQLDRTTRESVSRADHDPPGRGLQARHVQPLAGRDREAAALPDGEMDQAVVAAEHAAVDVHDLARLAAPGRSFSTTLA